MKYLATLIKNFGCTKEISYLVVSAKNIDSARNKVGKYIRRNMPLNYSLVSVAVANVSLSPDVSQLKRQIAQAERELELAEHFLAVARRKRNELKKQLWALDE